MVPQRWYKAQNIPIVDVEQSSTSEQRIISYTTCPISNPHLNIVAYNIHAIYTISLLNERFVFYIITSIGAEREQVNSLLSSSHLWVVEWVTPNKLAAEWASGTASNTNSVVYQPIPIRNTSCKMFPLIFEIPQCCKIWKDARIITLSSTFYQQNKKK